MPVGEQFLGIWQAFDTKNRKRMYPVRSRSAFSLIEVLMIVVVMGILAASAISHTLDTSVSANESVLKYNLDVIRGAIQRYKLTHDGTLPGQDKDDPTFKLELTPYLTSNFPKNPLDTNGLLADMVRFRDLGDPLVSHVGGNQGWLYDNTTGEFIANTDTLSCDGVTKYSEF